ncbi:DUF1826 domain-containing protein [Teredinibacter turnerae]|nr:DUF1826 domain-containing protein [Teredinibacter turnerae]
MSSALSMSSALTMSSAAERLFKADDDPSALTDIYRSDCNLAVWHRSLTEDVASYGQNLSAAFTHYSTRFVGNLAAVEKHLTNDLPPAPGKSQFIQDIVLLSDMFSELLALRQVGLRLAVLTRAMCPRFHVDRVPARLITTYNGDGTEWVENAFASRDRNGFVVVPDSAPINQLGSGQVALMKGEIWEGNEGKGLIHRSANANVHSPRCVLTLDCV